MFLLPSLVAFSIGDSAYWFSLSLLLRNWRPPGNDATDFSTRADRRRGDSAVEICFLHATRLQAERQTWKASCRRSNFASVFYFLAKMDSRQSESISDVFIRATCFVYRSGKPTTRMGMATRRFLSLEEIFVLRSSERGKIFCGSGFEKTRIRGTIILID